MSNQDELISQFKDVTGISDERARFYLDSANWTLQLAISSFYENQQEINDEHSEDIPVELPSDASSEQISPAVPVPQKIDHWTSRTSKPKVATLHNMSQQSSDDDDEEGQAFYAGGSERSGQQVLGPPKRKNFREQLTEMFKMAHESGAVAEQAPSGSRDDQDWGMGLRLGQTENDQEVIYEKKSEEQKPEPVILKLWSQGFSINNGDLRPYDNPENKEFLETVMKGQIPNELRKIGNMVSVDVEDHRHESYKKQVPNTKAFNGYGYGQTLGSPAPEVVENVTVASISNNDESRFELKVVDTEPTTMLQIRLPDGSRISAQFNLSHTINDIRRFIVSNRPQYANQNFTLVTSFPTKELTDVSVSIEEAGLKNASLMFRQK